MITSLKLRAVSREAVKQEPICLGVDSLEANYYMRFANCLREKKKDADSFNKRIAETKKRKVEAEEKKDLQALIRNHSHVK